MAESTIDHEHLIRIVSILTRMIQHTETVSEGRIEYDYRNPDYETSPKNCRTNEELMRL